MTGIKLCCRLKGGCLALQGHVINSGVARQRVEEAACRVCRAGWCLTRYGGCLKAGMKRIDYGACAANFDFDDDGIVNASIGGLLVPANAGALSALLLRAGADHDSPGVLCSVEKALVALPPIDPKHYGYVLPSLRSVPVAVVVSPDQFSVYEGIALAAAATGAIRRAFLSREQAQAWLREQARALKANRVWRTVHR